MLDETIIKTELLSNLAFLNASKALERRCGYPKNYFQMKLASPIPVPVFLFFKEICRLAEWHKAELSIEQTIIVRTFNHYYFPHLNLSAEERLLADFFSHQSLRVADEDGHVNTPEFLTLRDWGSEDPVPNPDYQVNGQSFSFRKQFHDLFHSSDLARVTKGMNILKPFLQTNSIVDETLVTFLCQQLNQDGIISITRPFKDFIIQRNALLSLAAGHMWDQLLFTLSIKSNESLVYPAMDVKLTYFFKKSLRFSVEQQAEPDTSVQYRHLLRSQCPEFIGTYTIVVIDRNVHIVKPTIQIPLTAPDSASLNTDFTLFLQELRSKPSTPLATLHSTSSPASSVYSSSSTSSQLTLGGPNCVIS